MWENIVTAYFSPTTDNNHRWWIYVWFGSNINPNQWSSWRNTYDFICKQIRHTCRITVVSNRTWDTGVRVFCLRTCPSIYLQRRFWSRYRQQSAEIHSRQSVCKTSSLRLQPYKFGVKHTSGALNPSDYLSRHSVGGSDGNRTSLITEKYINFVISSAVPQARSLNQINNATKADTHFKLSCH